MSVQYPKSVLHNWSSTTMSGKSTVAGSTQYFPVQSEINFGTEGRAGIHAPCDGVIEKIIVRATPHATETSTVTLRVGGSDTALEVTLTGGGAEAEFESTGLVEMDEGDAVMFKVVTAAGGAFVLRRTEVIWRAR